MSNVKIEILKGIKSGRREDQQALILGAKGVKMLGFKEVVFSAHNLTLRRPSISDIRYKKISSYKFTMPVDEELVGDYNLVKLDEDTFQLVKIEENG